MKEGDRELIACDALCVVVAYRSKMLRERARLLRESAEEQDLSKLEAELRELEIRKFQLDADNAEIDTWNNQLTNCTGRLNFMQKHHHLHHEGESQPRPPPPTSPCNPDLHSTEPVCPGTRCGLLHNYFIVTHIQLM